MVKFLFHTPGLEDNETSGKAPVQPFSTERRQTGKVWTTDAPYRETRTKVADYARQGIYGVDMEFSALCTVAAFRGVELAAAMLVSDEVWKQPWQPQFSRKEFKRKSRKLLTLLCDTLWDT